MANDKYGHGKKNDEYGNDAADVRSRYDMIARYSGLASRFSHLAAWWNLAALPLLWAVPHAGVLTLLCAAAFSAFSCAVFRAFCMASDRETTAAVALVALLLIVSVATFLSMGLLDWLMRLPIAVGVVVTGYLAGPLAMPVVNETLRLLVMKYRSKS